MKEKLINIVYALLKVFPLIVQEKIKIILNVLCNDWRLAPFKIIQWSYNPALKDEDVDKHFAGLDERSLTVLKRFLQGQRLYFIEEEKMSYCFYSRKGLYTREEYKLSVRAYKQDRKMRKLYGLAKFMSNAVSSTVFQHGLVTLPEEQLKRLAGTAFIDAGAFIGDSTLMMLKYAPSRIYAFEPSEKNGSLFREIMKHNHITSDCYELIPAGLGEANTKMQNFNDTGNEGTNIYNNNGSSTVDIYALDSFWKEEYGRIGFIKADVEGAAVELLRGAEQTVRKYLPVLSIAVYHNETEFFGVYELLKSWNLPYRIEFQKHYYCWDNAEIVLMAIPEE